MTSATPTLPAALLQAAITGDEATVRATVAPGIVWHTPPSTLPDYRGPHHGADAVLALLAGGGAAFVPGSRRIEIERQISEGDLVAVDWRHIATLHDGSVYDNLYSFWFRVDGDRIAEVWENFDTGYLYGHLGLDPAGWVKP